MYHISPSLLCADQLKMEQTVKDADALGIDWFHLDVMDGCFVPNFAFGTDFISAIRGIAKAPMYVHMMTEHPMEFTEAFAELKVDYYCFHYETTANQFRLCEKIKACGMKAAVALNPSTGADVLKDLLPYLSAVTLMSVEPGFSGQKFLPHTYQKIRRLKELIGDLPVLIEVDGGADFDISMRCIANGADVVVGGYFTFFDKRSTPEENYKRYAAKLKEMGYDNTGA